MPRALPSYTELLLRIQGFQARLPGATEAMQAAAQAYLTDPDLHDGLRAARPYTERLAHAALNCAEKAAPEDFNLACQALCEVVPLAIKEQQQARESEQAAQEHAEKTRFGTGVPEPRAVRDPVKERIDR